MNQAVSHPVQYNRSLFSIPLDQVLCVLAIVALIFVPTLGFKGVLGFLAAGGFLILRHLNASINQLLRHWYILLLPLFCTLTFLWSQYPPQTLRFGVQLSVTVAISVVIAHRISPRTFVLTLFWALGIAMVASILFGEVKASTGAWRGIYGSKNAMAGAAAIYIVVAFGLAIERTASPRFRAIAAMGVVVGMVPLIFAQSVSALMIVPPAMIVLLSFLILPVISPKQRAVMAIFLVLIAALIGVLIYANIDTLLAWMLDTTGKDITLTGRTDLWKIALEFIAERPFFGMGYQAFWVKGHQPAEVIWFMFGISARSGFNFHNTYLSNAVEIGILGVMLQAFVLYGALYLTGRWAMYGQQAVAALLFTLVMMVVWISFIEVPIFFQFSLRTLIIVCALVYGIQTLNTKPSGTGRGTSR
ncbi:MAG: O-antigen ligase family protein [Paracoccaceae bacterium]